ncbi:MAG: DUF433 domain-containing protein [Anaerolineae bacterium]|uniref:DUF433 domain-containing protein n=1 Tax=Candidatus Amarolinea dominans TaxID=3140696 RepID=UPI00313538DF|nr:DUF433 domain-containing protein [Anaerolineae bacterium]
MRRIRWQERVVVDAGLHHGDPCIKGTRIPVAMIIGSLADGMSYGQIRQAYPQLSDEDISASLAYAADVLPSYRLASSANQ